MILDIKTIKLPKGFTSLLYKNIIGLIIIYKKKSFIIFQMKRMNAINILIIGLIILLNIVLNNDFI